MEKIILTRDNFRSRSGREYRVVIKEKEVAEGEKCFQVELYLPFTRVEKGMWGKEKTDKDFLLVYLNSYPVHGVESHVEMVYKFVAEYESKPYLVEDPFHRRQKAVKELADAFGDEEEQRPADEPQAAGITG